MSKVCTYIRNAKFCKLVIFAAIDSLTNATDSILISYVDSKSPSIAAI